MKLVLGHGVHSTLLSAVGLNLPPNFQKHGGERLDRISIFRGGYWERGCDLSQGGCSFYIKNEIKSEYLMTTKFINKNVFLYHNHN